MKVFRKFRKFRMFRKFKKFRKFRKFSSQYSSSQIAKGLVTQNDTRKLQRFRKAFPETQSPKVPKTDQVPNHGEMRKTQRGSNDKVCKSMFFSNKKSRYNNYNDK